MISYVITLIFVILAFVIFVDTAKYFTDNQTSATTKRTKAEVTTNIISNTLLILGMAVTAYYVWMFVIDVILYNTESEYKEVCGIFIKNDIEKYKTDAIYNVLTSVGIFIGTFLIWAVLHVFTSVSVTLRTIDGKLNDEKLSPH